MHDDQEDGTGPSGVASSEDDVRRPRGQGPWYTDAKVWEELKPLARQKRHEPTAAEDVLWQALRGRQVAGAKFRRQFPIATYIVDFCCPQAPLVVEVDGSVHAAYAENDAVRQDAIESCGMRVLRFRNEQVLGSLPQVLEAIERALAEPHP
jgi:very-short-patch-repair endonuclease